MPLTLSKYPHPGKYEGELLIAAVLHELSQSGCDEEVGDISESGSWSGLLYGPFKSSGPFADITPAMIAEHNLTPDDLAYLSQLAAVIIHETDQGFVSVDYFGERARADGVWADLQD